MSATSDLFRVTSPRPPEYLDTPPPSHETPVTMYFRQTGRPSKNAVWSALYLGRATLAIIATSLNRGNTPRGDQS